MKFVRVGSMLLMALLALGASHVARAGDEADFPRITVEELKAALAAKKQKVVIIDVRGGDYDESDTMIQGAIRIPPGELEAHLARLPRNAMIVTYCACSTDGGAVKAGEKLLAAGFKNVRALRGGWNAWKDSGGALQPRV